MNTIKKPFFISTLMIIIFALSGFSIFAEENNFDYGRVENGVYLNDYFKFRITIPVKWVVQSKEQVERIKETGKELLAGEDENMKAVVSASEINSANLLAAFQYELGSTVKFNPNIMIVVENTQSTPGIKTGGDYLFHAKRLLEQGQFKYDYLSEEFRKETINGSEFYIMDAYVNYMNMKIQQNYYSTVRNGFSFSVILSYVTDEQKKILLKSLTSMTFEK